MVMSQANVVALAKDVLIPGWQQEKQRLDAADNWGRWNPDKVTIPAHSAPEHRDLRDLSETPWLMLVVTTINQQLVAELVRSSQSEDVQPIWTPWLRNRMPSRQRAIHRAALTYGYSYSTVLPGEVNGEDAAVIRGHSPRDLYAVYNDAVVDEYPEYFLEVHGNRFEVVDDEARYTLVMQDGKLQFVTFDAHDVGVAPAVRYSNLIDVEGRTPGEVEPFIPLAKRINKTSYDRLLTQHFNSWKIRYATGLDMPESQEERDRVKMLLRQQDILTGEEGVTFGTLDETPLDGFIAAWKSDIEALAAVSQTPTHALTGEMINLSADAIEEARSMLDLKANERKIGFGDSHAQTLRLASHVEGREQDASDFTLTIQWADLGSRSLSQAADALGKLSTQLGIPPEKLWDRIPSVTAEEAASWLEYRQQHPSSEQLLADALRGQANGTDSAGATAN
ncbi:phage portal protein [Curtobacterium sp. SORGH_AS_0776]|uniref:phage portal protein n=1 Tax=Curtobacterium sp. SORGH_AS_0776 TaxID=3041798 RepID=UPI00285E9B50|nr:phage portal protein [Curtobacterium sp. SORGH_AS_0776]MDR6172641.1 hypothetical protein [Curtobacterium sp. SORGH_AS_0776]